MILTRTTFIMKTENIVPNGDTSIVIYEVAHFVMHWLHLEVVVNEKCSANFDILKLAKGNYKKFVFKLLFLLFLRALLHETWTCWNNGSKWTRSRMNSSTDVQINSAQHFLVPVNLVPIPTRLITTTGLSRDQWLPLVPIPIRLAPNSPSCINHHR